MKAFCKAGWSVQLLLLLQGLIVPSASAAPIRTSVRIHSTDVTSFTLVTGNHDYRIGYNNINSTIVQYSNSNFDVLLESDSTASRAFFAMISPPPFLYRCIVSAYLSTPLDTHASFQPYAILGLSFNVSTGNDDGSVILNIAPTNPVNDCVWNGTTCASPPTFRPFPPSPSAPSHPSPSSHPSFPSLFPSHPSGSVTPSTRHPTATSPPAIPTVIAPTIDSNKQCSTTSTDGSSGYTGMSCTTAYVLLSIQFNSLTAISLNFTSKFATDVSLILSLLLANSKKEDMSIKIIRITSGTGSSNDFSFGMTTIYFQVLQVDGDVNALTSAVQKLISLLSQAEAGARASTTPSTSASSSTSPSTSSSTSSSSSIGSLIASSVLSSASSISVAPESAAVGPSSSSSPSSSSPSPTSASESLSQQGTMSSSTRNIIIVCLTVGMILLLVILGAACSIYIRLRKQRGHVLDEEISGIEGIVLEDRQEGDTNTKEGVADSSSCTTRDNYHHKEHSITRVELSSSMNTYSPDI